MDQIRGGYLALDKGMGSNHRDIWINILGQHLFGAMEHNFIPAKAWQLKCQDPRVVAKYSKLLKDEINQGQISQRTDKL